MRYALVLSILAAGCASTGGADDVYPTAPKRSFGAHVQLLQRHTETIVLGEEDGAQIAVCPELQGRVMTSTVAGPDGRSHGWVNEDLVRSGELQPKINAYGGEDRLWLGPEGGQFSLFFEPGSKQDLAAWRTPPPVDSEPWEVVSRSGRQVSLRHRALLTNSRGSVFDVSIDRTVRLLEPGNAARLLGVQPGHGLQTVAFESENRLTNVGPTPWRPEDGLLSLWIIGMFPAGPSVTVVLPIRAGSEEDLGRAVTTDYFEEPSGDRMKVTEDAVFFKGDARKRTKIGVPPARAKGLLASYDPDHGVLTFVQYTQPEGATRYVDSRWRYQVEPYDGDVIHSYNDGPPAPGQPGLGPFYELESSSPAAALSPGASVMHLHRTFHFVGEERQLDALARQLLDLGLEEISGALYR